MLVRALYSFTLVGAEWVLWLLVALSFLSVAIMVERLIFFYRHRIHPERLGPALLEHLDRGDIKGARSVLTGGSMEVRVLLNAMEHLDRGPESVEDVMTGSEARERLRLDRGLVVLGTLGNNAPFIGLFGTVLGIIRAFADLAQNSSGGAEVVMAGISEALVATAVGLFVAIPAVVAFNFFSRLSKRVQANTQSLTRLVLAHLRTQSAEPRPQLARGEKR